jgi:hypothetical protein
MMLLSIIYYCHWSHQLRTLALQVNFDEDIVVFPITRLKVFHIDYVRPKLCIRLLLLLKIPMGLHGEHC